MSLRRNPQAVSLHVEDKNVPALKCISLLLLVILPGMAQNLMLQGQVSDETGAVIPNAKILLEDPSGVVRSVQSASDGRYSFSGLPPNDYVLNATAPQLGLKAPLRVTVRSSSQTVNIVLQVFVHTQQVTVDENAKPTVSTDAAANASALVLQGADLDALSDNTDDLAADLQALAGPGAGPNGGSIFIDGFSGGQLPPKNSIREIRINQNPFSPEYDKLGFGRIEIFTKPGTDKFHGDFGYNFATDKWNSRNPYAVEKAPFHLHELREMLSGPLSKRASFNLIFLREWVDNGNVVNAVILNRRPWRSPRSLIRPWPSFAERLSRPALITRSAPTTRSASDILTIAISFAMRAPGHSTSRLGAITTMQSARRYR